MGVRFPFGTFRNQLLSVLRQRGLEADTGQAASGRKLLQVQEMQEIIFCHFPDSAASQSRYAGMILRHTA